MPETLLGSGAIAVNIWTGIYPSWKVDSINSKVDTAKGRITELKGRSIENLQFEGQSERPKNKTNKPKGHKKHVRHSKPLMYM